jgi:GT2 family glycosyltransferase
MATPDHSSQQSQQATDSGLRWSRPEISPAGFQERPQVRGKFLCVGDEKLYIRGVTYGTFRPDESGNEFHDPEVVERDFAQMGANGINAVRTYTPPPSWLLDIAWRNGLLVMVGLPWEQHVTFLDSRKTATSIENRIRQMIREIAGHPAVLCYVIGNEIPAPIVRWHGRKKIERFLKRLYLAAKAEDPHGLVTYVNYPTTEYLQLPFLDFFCFNVYLEEEDRLEAYLYRLQSMVGDHPLIMGEIGLDSRRNGERKQAEVLEWQIRTSFRIGCAGVFVFSWTDEWYRGGYDIEDWDFGLTGRNRLPKPALAAVRTAFSEVPFPQNISWPRVSVVVCSYNGAYTIRDCFEGLSKLDYPNFEVIVVNDGSTDSTPAIAGQYGFRLISTENRGLSSARNAGLEAATGEIVAYLDDDAYPDPDWLKYLAATFITTECAGVGGPNIPPPGNGKIAECVANAPGGPLHVLISDREAEHIPGCNMAFRRECLKAIGGFDPQFRAAGDDVDLCWRIQQRGWWLAFHPAAMVWHFRRNSVRNYWRQQKGYGKAEALLEEKWPEKYNSLGHLTWAGKIYGNGITKSLSWRKWRVYHGTWGSALFQSLYGPGNSTLQSLPCMPEWYMLNISLAVLSVLGVFWKPLFLVLPLLAVTASVPLLYVIRSVAQASFASKAPDLSASLKLRLLTASLHVVQPIARLYGRLRHGLTPWRRRNKHCFTFPRRLNHTIWSERWQEPQKRLEAIEAKLRERSVNVRRGGDYDRWDLEVRGGLIGTVRLLMAIEEHGGGRQLLRFLAYPRCSVAGLVPIFLLAFLAVGAAFDQAWTALAILATVDLLWIFRAIQECGGAASVVLDALEQVQGEES